jgi:hypothetical protein
MTTRMARRITVVGSSLLLAACTTPFSEKLSSIDWAGQPAEGTIAVSQPKMYRRASLINERRLEVEWLDKQLDDSKTIEFKPEIIREVEQITAFAAALGLSFDPASALNYRRASETGGLQQQIETMKLQLQLDQLRRDAELVRGKFASQTDPVNADLGKVTAGAPPAASSPTTAAAADQLKSAIDKLMTALQTRLDVEAKPAATANSSVNPADVFRDRSAYRDLLKSARNAASLDDSHDLGGSALIRLNFQAMVVPDRENSKVPGVVQMTVKAPTIDEPARARLYSGWLDYINQQLNRDATAIRPDGEILNSAAADNFERLEYRYELPASRPDSAGVSKLARSGSKVKSTGKTPETDLASARNTKTPGTPSGSETKALCSGFNLKDRDTVAQERCGVLAFAAPRFKGTSSQEGSYVTLRQYLESSYLDKGDEEIRQASIASMKLIAPHAKEVAPACGLPLEHATPKGSAPNRVQQLREDIRTAQIRVAAGDVFARIERGVQRLLKLRNIEAPIAQVQTARIYDSAARSRLLLSTFEEAAYSGCPVEAIAAFRASFPTLYVPPGFLDVLKGENRTVVYEIGPREQVQQVSTVSRVANNLSLAVSLAAAAPRSGAGANAAASYSRQAIGKAAALERVPALIGFSVADGTFGWVIGPRATVDPKGSVQLEQTARTMDLSVDVSVPSWWPSFNIETVTGWAPSPASVTKGAIEMRNQRKTAVTIPMDVNYADYQVLTARIMRTGLNESRQVSLDDRHLTGQSVSACLPSNLYLQGSNIWRATTVLLAGQRLDEGAILVAPDMSGIFLTVPALDELLGAITGPKVPISVFTRYGEAIGDVDYVPKPLATCKPAPKKAAAEGPVIASLVPTQFQAGATMVFTAEGSKLDQVSRVTINGQPGAVSAAKGGKSLQATFTAAQTASLPVSRTIALSFFKGDDKLGEKLVEVTANRGVK